MADNNSRGMRLGATFLFSGYVAKIDPQGRPEPAPESLRPVRNLVMFTSDPARSASPGALDTWMTDDKGMLSSVGRPGPVHYHGSKRSFVVVPPSVLLQAWGAYRGEWPRAVADILAKKSTGPGVELTEIIVAKSQLAPPDRSSEDPAEKEYAKWYDGPESRMNFAFVLPKVRGVVVQFTDPALSRASVRLVLPDRKSEMAARFTNSAATFYASDPKKLPAGLYRIVVTPTQPAEGWSSAVRQSKDKSYELVERLRFNINNFAGDFDLVLGDPLTVEESILLQFSALYANYAGLAKQKATLPDAGADPKFKELDKLDLPASLKAWGERVGWASTKASLAVKRFNGERAKPWELGKKLLDGLPNGNEYFDAARKSIGLGFSVHKNAKEWKDLIEDFKAEKDLKDLKAVVWNEVDGHFAKLRWWKYAKEEAIEGRPLNLMSLSEKERKLVFRAGIPSERKNLEEVLGKRMGQAIPKALAFVDSALEAYNVALAFNDVLEARKKLEEVQTDFRTLAGKVKDELDGLPSREGIGNLERMRTATVVADLKLSDEAARAAMAAVDLVLSVASAVVGGPVLGAVVLVKATIGLARDIVVDAGEWLDRTLLEGFLSDSMARRGQLVALLSASASNQSLLRAEKDDAVQVQFRLRAEVLYGLVGLLTRAAVASRSVPEYLERVKKYRVKEYIDTYVLNDGWQVPLRPLVPISMDTYWLYAAGKYGVLRTTEGMNDNLGLRRPITKAAIDAVPGGMFMLAVAEVLVKDNVQASFQKSFPIHHLESASVEEMAKTFRIAWPELKSSSVEYTCLYTRPRDSDDPLNWRPLNQRGAKHVEELPLLSPLDPVRVLIVLKQGIEEALYPVSVQVRRVDGVVNIDGPIYREILRPLDAELLPSEERFKGRLGCVVYPFYQFGLKVFPGLKPLAGAMASWGYAYALFGGLDDMRYQLKVRLGDQSSGFPMDIGGQPGSKAKIEEVRVQVGDRGTERMMAQDSDFLRREGEAFKYPKLFTSTYGAGPVFARVGAGPYQLPTLKDDAVVQFEKFDWNTPVEFVVVAWSFSLATDNWDNQQLDWRKLPATMQLVNFDGWDTGGPRYPSTLHYVGQIVPQSGVLSPAGDVSSLSPGVAEWLQQLKARPDLARNLGRCIDHSSAMDYRHHLFAAHFRPWYHTPAGDRVEGLRPFGKMQTEGNYRIGIVNVTSAQDSGLEQEQLKAPGALVANPEFEFRFPVPRSFTAGVPWAKGSIAKKQRPPTPDEIRTWIQTQPEKKEGPVELMASGSDE